MSKYSKKELKAKAIAALKYEKVNSPAFVELILEVCIRTGLTPNIVYQRIKRLAQ